jgi:hypothetical protein
MKYKVNINKPAPQEQEIEDSKNFNRVLRQYREKRESSSLHTILLKLNKQLPVLIITILMIMIVYYFSKVMKKIDKIEQKTPPKQELKQAPNQKDKKDFEK